MRVFVYVCITLVKFSRYQIFTKEYDIWVEKTLYHYILDMFKEEKIRLKGHNRKEAMMMGIQCIKVYRIECIISSCGSRDVELEDRLTKTTLENRE